MAEALITPNHSYIPGEAPFIGDLESAEIFVNISDGRMWVADQDSVPIEVGGNAKLRPMGPVFFSSYALIDLTDPTQLPIANTDPSLVPSGFYTEFRMMLQFNQTPIPNIATYFDFEIDWGDQTAWQSAGVPTVPGATNPIDYFRRQGRKILIELSSFGPSMAWTGRILWVSQ